MAFIYRHFPHKMIFQSVCRFTQRKLSRYSLVNQKNLSCHYDILGLHKSASKKDIREAYFKKTKQYHPDKDPSDDSLHEKFVEVTQAYEILGDQHLKNIYDGISHPNIVYQQRTRRNSTSGTNPFGTYEDPGSEWHWDEGTRRKAYDEFYKTYKDYHKDLQKNYEERRSKNILLLSFLFLLMVAIGAFNFARIMLYHNEFQKHMDKRTAENAAFLKDSRTGYKSFVAKVTSEKSSEDSPS
ncbi:dnaJ homolog subfamily C member 4-like isoform X2 [Hydractinia symbiolongicarpus]|nr:dnaJ homolog subfamily C member 4-like isoform X2 [Hydractinia symbiolongicarpus]